jgi:hypothetical protein
MGENSKNKGLFVNSNKLETNNIQHKKNLLLEAMVKTLGNVSEACKLINIDRSMFYDYYNTDNDFKQNIDDIKNITLDFVESKLLKKVKDEDITAIIFYLKTQGKKRGYIEKTEQEITIQPPVVIDWSEPIQEAEEIKQNELKQDNEEAGE